MKTNIKFLSFILALSALFYVACSDDDSVDITTPEAALNLDMPSASTINLNFGFPDNAAFTLTWSDDLTGSTNYDIEMAFTPDFEIITPIGSSSTNSFTMSVEDFNMTINAANPASLTDITAFMRVRAGEVLSNQIRYVVTAYAIDSAELTSPSDGDEFVLSFDDADEVAMTISWDDFGATGSSSIDYTVEVAIAGTDFETPAAVVSVTDEFTANVITSDLNAVALGLGATPDTATDMDMRIIASSTSNNEVVYERVSDLISFSVTPYNVNFPYVYLVGASTAPGWDNNNNNPAVFRSQDVPNSYYYTGYFDQAGFKILEQRGNWHPQWGDRNNSTTLGVSEPDGANEAGVFDVPESGYYTMTMPSLSEGGSYTITAFDASAAPSYNTMGLIGDATPNGWDGDNDTNFTQSTFDPHIWYIPSVAMVQGNFLIRANDVWDGPDSAIWRWTGSQEIWGQASFNGSDIPWNGEDGNYEVWFNDLDGSYVFIPLED